MKNKKKIIRNIIILLSLIYVAYTLIKQQSVINQYSDTSMDLASQIEQEKDYKDELAKKQESINSNEFIESTAREKLDMYLPNEKDYFNTGM